jgi:hypothetical protein
MLGEKGTSRVTMNVQDRMVNDSEGEISLILDKSTSERLALKVTAQILTGAITRLATWWLEHPDEGTARRLQIWGIRR